MGKGKYQGGQKQRNKPFKGGKKSKHLPQFQINRRIKKQPKQKKLNTSHKIRKLQSQQRKKSQKLFQESNFDKIINSNINLTEEQRH